jgi:opacity protein-like surface antigen
MKKIGAGLTIAGALAFTALGMGAGVANADQPVPSTPGMTWKLDHGHGHGGGDWGGGDWGGGGWNGGGWNGGGWNGGGWNGGYGAPCGAGVWVPPAVWAWVPPAAWGC